MIYIMKRIIALLTASVMAAPLLKAQELVIPDGYEVVDSIICRPADAVDETLVGQSVFSSMPANTVTVRQSPGVRDSMEVHVRENASKKLTGYRIRIFFDNKQDSREQSEAVLKQFQTHFPGVAAYRSFVNPFFKVTVGDFRTKSEAARFHEQVAEVFATAFIVKENINFPVADKENAFVIDTLLLIKPINTSL